MSKLDFLSTYAIEGRHYNFEKEMNKALNDSDSDVRRAAIEHPKATEEHISKALNDSDSDVRRAAIEHPNYRKFFPNGH